MENDLTNHINPQLIRTLNCSFIKEACRAARRPSTTEYQFLVYQFWAIKIIK